MVSMINIINDMKEPTMFIQIMISVRYWYLVGMSS